MAAARAILGCPHLAPLKRTVKPAAGLCWRDAHPRRETLNLPAGETLSPPEVIGAMSESPATTASSSPDGIRTRDLLLEREGAKRSDPATKTLMNDAPDRPERASESALRIRMIRCSTSYSSSFATHVSIRNCSGLPCRLDARSASSLSSAGQTGVPSLACISNVTASF